MSSPTKPAKIDSLTAVSKISDVILLLQRCKDAYGDLPVFTTWESNLKLDSVEVTVMTEFENGRYTKKAVVF